VLPSATVAECELTAVIMLVYSQPQTPTHGDKEAVLVLTKIHASSKHIRVYCSVFLFFHFLLVGSVRYIKLTDASF